jgi:hypothetical protein
MLIIAMLVLIVAQPLLKDNLGAVLGGSKTHHIVLLDDSFSMSDRANGANAMDLAKETVDRIGTTVAGRSEAQTFTLLRFSQAGRIGRQTQPDLLQERVDSEFSTRLRDTLKRLNSSQTATGPRDAVQAIGQLLGDTEEETRIVYLISDFRKKEWDRPEDLRTLLSELANKGVAVHLINCVDKRRSNMAVTDLELKAGTVAAGISMFMEVEVHNFGKTTARGVSVTLEKDGHVMPAVRIRDIPPGDSVRERFEVTFAVAGQHRLVARLDGDAVTADNKRFAVVDVPLEVPVLVVDGSPDQRSSESLVRALAPGGSVRTGVNPRIETPRFLSANPVDSYGAVYLVDVEHLDERAVKTLEDYVAGGGGLAVFLGPNSRAGFLNETLWRNGDGLFPAPIAGERELLVDHLDDVPDLEVTEHPIFQIFGGQDNSFLSRINVGRYFATEKDWEPEPNSTARVIARLRNGAPLAVEQSFGKGRVIGWLSTAAPTWNNAARYPSFVVLVQEMQAYLSRRPESEAAPLVGTPLELTLDPARYQAKVRFVSPTLHGEEATTDDAVLDDKDEMLHARFARTDRAGFYEAQLLDNTGTAESRVRALNVESDEGDLSRADGPQLATRLAGLDYTYHDAKAFEARRDPTSGYNLSDFLLYLLLVLLVAELLLAWSCSYHPPQTSARAAFGRGGAA